MCYCDADQPAFINQTLPRAAKLHWCCECGGAIRQGEQYQRSSGKWDNRIDTYVRCIHCRDTVRFMYWWSKQTEGCYCEVFGQLLESVQEEWREGKSRLIGRIYIAMMRRWYRDRDERLVAYEARKAA